MMIYVFNILSSSDGAIYRCMGKMLELPKYEMEECPPSSLTIAQGSVSDGWSRNELISLRIPSKQSETDQRESLWMCC